MLPARKKLELFFWSCVPPFITLLFLVAYLAPKHISGLAQFMPLLHMIPIYFWGLTHARDMPYLFVFALGLVVDAISGQPMGLSSLMNVLFLVLIHAQYKYIYKEGFVVKWGYFAGMLGIYAGAHWAVLFVFFSQSHGFWTALLQWLLTACCYPFFHLWFDRLHQHITQQRWQLLHGR